MPHDPDVSNTDPVGVGFLRWRDEARQMASALMSARYLGSVLVDPTAAERIAALLLEAEPPGTGAAMVEQGYKAGRERLGVEVSNG